MAPDITLFPIQQTMPSPLISVIVPIYNMESLLPRCLDSLAAQTLRDLEIICVDDGSTDGSGGIVRKYASGDSRFRLITQENSGRAEARNAGIRAAAAPYLGLRIQMTTLSRTCTNGSTGSRKKAGRTWSNVPIPPSFRLKAENRAEWLRKTPSY